MEKKGSMFERARDLHTRRRFLGNVLAKGAITAGVSLIPFEAFGLDGQDEAQGNTEIKKVKSECRDGVVARAEIGDTCDGALAALMRIGFSQKDAYRIAMRTLLFIPENAQSASLQSGTLFVRTGDNAVRITHKDKVLAEIDCAGKITPFSGKYIKVEPGGICKPNKEIVNRHLHPLQDVREVVPAPKIAEVKTLPLRTTDALMQRVLYKSCDEKSSCDKKGQYINVLHFDTLEKARESLERANQANNEGFWAAYQDELPIDECFIVIGGRCYQIGFTKNGKEGALRTHVSSRSHTINIRDVETGERAIVHEHDMRPYLNGLRSGSAMKHDLEDAELYTREVENRHDAFGVFFKENGVIDLDVPDGVAQCTVYQTLYAQSGMSEASYMRFLNERLPGAFSFSMTHEEKLSTLLALGQRVEPMFNPITAQNMLMIMEQGGTDGSSGVTVGEQLIRGTAAGANKTREQFFRLINKEGEEVVVAQ